MDTDFDKPMGMGLGNAFHKDGTQSKEGSSCPSQHGHQNRLWRQRKQCWKLSAATQKRRRSTCHPPSYGQRHCGTTASLSILGRAYPGETSLTTMPSSSSADSRSTMEKIEDNTLVFTVYVKASKHQIKQAVKKLYDFDVAKVSTLISLPERRRHVTGSRVWCFGCCEQNWDHWNWVQLANCKHENFIL